MGADTRPEAEEMEITPEMVRAGHSAAFEIGSWWDGPTDEEMDALLRRVYTAMRRAANSGSR
ncbi:MAG TPA: hypothetical protein VHU23_00890 [Rhizomicrobium sp.]|jgi:hypothetical protein|nr:hypothetical protein [Rhizomicrobium sp.]